MLLKKFVVVVGGAALVLGSALVTAPSAEAATLQRTVCGTSQVNVRAKATTASAKVGTIKRAKGLEFKQVLIPDIRREHTITQPPTDETDRERWDLTRRELYVAMTRARDGLWVGISN